ncbi:MAG: hypothetical protein IT329_16445 [Caldilineaceae bacterium]|nr:hypothetical protein [Caldilineaceae bacterium]
MSDSEQASLVAFFQGWLSTWVPIVTALISLVISLYTFVVATQAPEVRLIMPDVVRIAQGGESGPFVYLQPIFVNTGQSERVEVVTGVQLRVEPVDQPGGVDFVWDEQGTWLFDPNTQSLNWAFTADPGAFLVNANNAQDFTGLFIGPQAWRFAPGVYRIQVIAERATARTPLAASIEVELAQADIDYLDEAQGTRFLTFTARH